MQRILALALAATTVAVGLTACSTTPVEPAGQPLTTPTERVDATPRTVIVERLVEKRVEVPVTVTETVDRVVTDPAAEQAAYERGYAAARAEFEVPDDYWADWWEDGYDAGQSATIRDAAEPGGVADPASIMAALETPCVVEDAENCYWDAAAMGNGTGSSFVNVEGSIYPLTALLGQ
jgi:hypothetical protein